MVVPRVLPEAFHRPDSPRERELRKQVNDLHAKVAHMQEAHERVVAEMRAARERERTRVPKDRIIYVPRPETSADLESALARGAEHAAALYRCQVEGLRQELRAMQVRLEAGMSRRTRMLVLLKVALRCEEDHDLSDEESDALMETFARAARSIISCERLARAQNKLAHGWEYEPGHVGTKPSGPRMNRASEMKAGG